MGKKKHKARPVRVEPVKLEPVQEPVTELVRPKWYKDFDTSGKILVLCLALMVVWVAANIPRVVLSTEYHVYNGTIRGIEYRGDRCALKGDDGEFIIPSKFAEGLEVGDTVLIHAELGVFGREILSVEVMPHA